MPASKHGSEQYVKYTYTTDSVDSRPTSWEIALHAGSPGNGDDNEVADGSYARQSATFAASDQGSFWQAASDIDVTFPAASASANYTVTHFTVRDALSGECKSIGVLPVPIPVVEGGVVSLPAGSIIVRGV